MRPISVGMRPFSTSRPAPAQSRDWRQGGSGEAAASWRPTFRARSPISSGRRHLWQSKARRSMWWSANRVCSSFPTGPQPWARCAAHSSREDGWRCRVVPHRGQFRLCGPPRGAARQRSCRSGRPAPGALRLARSASHQGYDRGRGLSRGPCPEGDATVDLRGRDFAGCRGALGHPARPRARGIAHSDARRAERSHPIAPRSARQGRQGWGPHDLKHRRCARVGGKLG